MSLQYNVFPGIDCYYSADKGRYLVANREFDEGVELAREEPFLACLELKCWDQICFYCMKQGGIIPCMLCRRISYCSEECKKADITHELECKGLPKVTEISQLYIPRIYNLFEMFDQSDFPINYFNLVSFPLKVSQKIRAELRKQVSLCSSMCKKELSFNDVLKAFSMYSYNLTCRFQTNGFVLYDQNMTGIGVSVYRKCSLFNHECLPNCRRWFDGRTIIIRSLYKIRPGDQLTISYGGLEYNRIERLEEHYSFRCKCKFCKNDKLLPASLMSMMERTIEEMHKNNTRNAYSFLKEEFIEHMDELEDNMNGLYDIASHLIKLSLRTENIDEFHYWTEYFTPYFFKVLGKNDQDYGEFLYFKAKIWYDNNNNTMAERLMREYGRVMKINFGTKCGLWRSLVRTIHGLVPDLKI